MNRDTLERQDPVTAPADEISFLELVNGVLRNWRTVLLLPLVLVAAVLLVTLLQERAFTASASFVPQTAEGRNLSGAAALAQQFGVSLATDRPGQSSQFYVDLLRSAAILRRAVETEYRIPAAEGTGEWVGNLVQYWELEGEDRRGPPWREAVDRLKESITTTVSRETSIVLLTVAAEHPLLAERIAERLIELLHEYNVHVRQNQAQEEARFISGRLTEAQRELLSVERELQAFLRQNREFRGSPELTFQYDRLQRQVMLRQEVLVSLLRAQEEARIDGVRDTPLLTVIDVPAGTGRLESLQLPLRIVIAALLGLLLAVALAYLRESARRGTQAGDPLYGEFRHLARRAWSDLRHPRQWLRHGKDGAPGSERAVKR